MNRVDAKHLAEYERDGWEEVIAIAKFRLKRIAEAEQKYRINRQKARIREESLNK